MKKILIPSLIVALAFTVTATATVATPNIISTTTGATSTRTESHGDRVTSTKSNGDKNGLNKKELKAADPSCAKNALAKRDALVIAALQKYTTEWINVINTRRAEQNIAFEKTGSERVKLIQSSRVTAKKAEDLIQKELRKTKSAASEVYRGQMRICGLDIDSRDE
ncbi:hypothetical protein H7Y21_03065 [Arenimonas sp.]|nr:hypothetical protein [Candidatus Parcubacteria bacterium]